MSSYFTPSPRERLRVINSTFSDSNGFSTSWPSTSEYIRDYNKGPGACTHWKAKPFNIDASYIPSINTSNRYHYSVTDHVLPPGDAVFGYANTYIARALEQFNSTFDWAKLPSSTEANIISILAEIDDTIAMFTLRFWRYLSYGSLNWGVLPFISDLKAVLRTLQNLYVRLNHIRYTDTNVVNVDIPPQHFRASSGDDITYIFSISNYRIRKSGYVDMSDQNPISIWLDRLGFHPNLATAWDLVPFSFVVDYLLPIGDLLESLSPPGWVQAVYFSGWFTVRYDLTWTHINSNWTGTYGSSFRSFSRGQLGSVVTYEPKRSDLQLTLPSPKECFNMLYLLFTHFKR